MIRQGNRESKREQIPRDHIHRSNERGVGETRGESLCGQERKGRGRRRGETSGRKDMREEGKAATKEELERHEREPVPAGGRKRKGKAARRTGNFLSLQIPHLILSHPQTSSSSLWKLSEIILVHVYKISQLFWDQEP